MKKGNILTRGRMAGLAALVLTLGAAVYLNWNMGRQNPVAVSGVPGTETTEVSAAAPEIAAVFDPLESENAAAEGENIANKNYGEAQLVSVNKDTGTEFFDAARLARTKARDEALDDLKKSLKNASLTDAEKQQLTTTLSAQVNNVTMESNLETIIKAKGFADCVVSVDGKRANVTVMTENDALTAAEVAKIRDVLLNQCRGMAAQDITIVEVK